MSMPEKALPFPLPVVPPRFTKENVGAQNRKLAKKLYADFFNWPIERSQKILETTPAEVWEREGQKRALQIFHAAAERVPAYKDFLKREKIQHEKVRNIDDYKVIPPVDKENYLRKYSLEELSWDGVLRSSHIISVSSGSTGEPFFWPRGQITELETSYFFEVLLSQVFNIGSKTTLFVNCWAMGMWVGGTITLSSVLRLAQKGLPVTVVTPGNKIEEILHLLPRLKPYFDAIVIAAYPPFLKDIIDEGRERGIDWSKYNLKLLLAGESISESWRDYVAELAGGRDPQCDFVSIYGTADAGALAHETPASIKVRRAVNGASSLTRQVFRREILPSLLQYYPTLRYFESVNGELIFTASVGIPLVRYNIHDQGGILSRRDLFVNFNDVSTVSVVSKNDWALPFVYLFGRTDFTTSLYGANIYPENIRMALERYEIRNFVSGRFSMSTENTRKQDQYLLVNVELTKNVRPNPQIKRLVVASIVRTLLDINSEFRDVARAVGTGLARPRVRLFKKGDNKYFQSSIKQRWTTKRRI